MKFWARATDNRKGVFVRDANFLRQNDVYKALKTTLKAVINEET